MNESDETRRNIVPIRGRAGDHHPDETRMRAFILFATEAARNCSAVERLLAEELQGTDVAVPTKRVIADWCQHDNWHKQADEVWRSTKLWGINELKVLAMANALLGQRRRNEILQGKWVGNNDAAAQFLKAGELSDRFVERVIPLSMMQMPQEASAVEVTQNRDEREAKAKGNMITRKSG